MWINTNEAKCESTNETKCESTQRKQNESTQMKQCESTHQHFWGIWKVLKRFLHVINCNLNSFSVSNFLFCLCWFTFCFICVDSFCYVSKSINGQYTYIDRKIYHIFVLVIDTDRKASLRRKWSQITKKCESTQMKQNVNRQSIETVVKKIGDHFHHRL
jgi:hypothetical protein